MRYLPCAHCRILYFPSISLLFPPPSPSLTPSVFSLSSFYFYYPRPLPSPPFFYYFFSPATFDSEISLLILTAGVFIFELSETGETVTVRNRVSKSRLIFRSICQLGGYLPSLLLEVRTNLEGEKEGEIWFNSTCSHFKNQRSLSQEREKGKFSFSSTIEIASKSRREEAAKMAASVNKWLVIELTNERRVRRRVGVERTRVAHVVGLLAPFRQLHLYYVAIPSVEHQAHVAIGAGKEKVKREASASCSKFRFPIRILPSMSTNDWEE